MYCSYVYLHLLQLRPRKLLNKVHTVLSYLLQRSRRERDKPSRKAVYVRDLKSFEPRDRLAMYLADGEEV